MKINQKPEADNPQQIENASLRLIKILHWTHFFIKNAQAKEYFFGKFINYIIDKMRIESI